jgi:hypothetical protein
MAVALGRGGISVAERRLNLARPFKAGDQQNTIFVASATVEISIVADATRSKPLTVPALKRRAKLTPTLRVEKRAMSGSRNTEPEVDRRPQPAIST